jgi:hypothetical protein
MEVGICESGARENHGGKRAEKGGDAGDVKK